MSTAALFDVDEHDAKPWRLKLEHVDRRGDDMLWLRYRVEH